MKGERVEVGGLLVDVGLYKLVRDEIAPGTEVDADEFWNSLGRIVTDLEPGNRALLDRRDELQQQIDAWHAVHRESGFGGEEARDFLIGIGKSDNSTSGANRHLVIVDDRGTDDHAQVSRPIEAKKAQGPRVNSTCLRLESIQDLNGSQLRCSCHRPPRTPVGGSKIWGWPHFCLLDVYRRG